MWKAYILSAVLAITTYLASVGSVSAEYGFRDLIIGGPGSVVVENCEMPSVPVPELDLGPLAEFFRDLNLFHQNDFVPCYGLVGLKFRFRLETEDGKPLGDAADWLKEFSYPSTGYELDVVTVSRIRAITINMGEYDPSYFEELFENLGARYRLEWVFTDNDVRLYEADVIHSLWACFDKGRVMLRINYNRFTETERVYLYYHTGGDGEILCRIRRSDFPGLTEF